MPDSIFNNLAFRSEQVGDIRAVHFLGEEELTRAIRELNTFFILLPGLQEKVRPQHPDFPTHIKGLECQLTFPSTTDERTGVSSMQLHTLDIEGKPIRISQIRLYSSDRDSILFSGFSSSNVWQTTGIHSASDHAKMLIEAYRQIQQGNYNISLAAHPFHPGYRIETLAIPGIPIMPFSAYSADRTIYHAPGFYEAQIEARRQQENPSLQSSRATPPRVFGQSALSPMKRRRQKPSNPKQEALPLS